MIKKLKEMKIQYFFVIHTPETIHAYESLFARGIASTVDGEFGSTFFPVYKSIKCTTGKVHPYIFYSIDISWF